MARAKGTGSIFKPKGSRFYWVAYVSGGKRRFEGTKSERKKDAQDLLTQRLGDVGHGIVVTPKVLHRSPELTHLRSREMTHPVFRPVA